MGRMSISRLSCICVWLTACGSLATAQTPYLPYRAEFVDGSRKAAETIGAWHETQASPAIDGWPMFDPDRPIRWLLNEAAAPEPPPKARVEFAGGDCLPGRVVAYRAAGESIRDCLPPHFEVVPYAAIDCPDMRPRDILRIRAGGIRRIVWNPIAIAYRPRTVYLEDGRQLDFRSVRFGDGEISLLREEGISRVPLGEVAELHFPPTDPWDAYFGQLAALSPDSTARIVEVVTVDGLRASGSTERFQARAVGDASKTENWWHAVQPAWSLEPIWIRHDRIWIRRFFLPHEVPLSRIEPAAVRQQPELAGTWHLAVDQNLEGRLLHSGGQEYLWGFGVHGSCELEFPLTAAATTFRVKLGLDRMAGPGGCVRAGVLLGPSRQSLYVSDFIVGSSTVLDTGPLSLGETPSSLFLRVNAAHDGRPAGADPFDIRDTFDWLAPLVELDRERVKQETARRSARLVPAWEGWSVFTGDDPSARLVNHWSESRREEGAWRLLAASGPARPLRISGKFLVRAERDRLMVGVSRPPQIPASRIEVRVDGQVADEFDVPVRERESPPPPRFISLADRQGQQVEIEIRQTGSDGKAAVEWHCLALVAAAEEEKDR